MAARNRPQAPTQETDPDINTLANNEAQASESQFVVSADKSDFDESSVAGGMFVLQNGKTVNARGHEIDEDGNVKNKAVLQTYNDGLQ